MPCMRGWAPPRGSCPSPFEHPGAVSSKEPQVVGDVHRFEEVLEALRTIVVGGCTVVGDAPVVGKVRELLFVQVVRGVVGRGRGHSVNEGPLSEPLSEPQRCPKWVHEGPHPTHPLRVGGGDPPLRVPPRMWFREGQKVLECLSFASF